MSLVSGHISVESFFKLIKGDCYRYAIAKLRETMKTGDNAKVDRMKKQLAYYTITGNYQAERLAYSLLRAQDIITLDFDDMELENLPQYRKLTNECPDTLGSFLSPRMHGLKVFVYLTGKKAEAMRVELNASGTVSYAALEDYHHRMYELARQQYETLLHTRLDGSGSDLSRGVFASYDPEAFFSSQRLANVKPLTVNVLLPTREECKKRKPRAKKSESLPQAEEPEVPVEGNAAAAPDLQTQYDFEKAMLYTKRKHNLKEGNRDNFFFCLGNQCYARHISEDNALWLADKHFGTMGGFDKETPLHNGYCYTSKTDRRQEGEKESNVCRVMHFMDECYELRRNVVKEQIEFRKKVDESSGAVPAEFTAIRVKDINTFYLNAQIRGLNCSQSYIKALVDSDYAKPFNPFTHYFYSLDKWDGQTDYIGQLAQTVEAVDQPFFEDSLRRWLVGMVACAIDDNVQNHQLLLLHSAQGKGKSFFIRHLLPPELSEYYRSGMIIPDNKDHLLQLSSRLIINLDEFDSISPWRMQELKHLIIQDVVTERKAFDIQTYNFVRRASFIASTNNPHCLQDIGENRRFLFNSVLNIDYRAPVNHAGVYAQALALWQGGFQYWYENEEVSFLNNRNEKFRQKEPIEENLFFYFRAAKGSDVQARWLPAAYLLSVLCMNGRMQSNKQVQQVLVTVLEKNAFRQRVTKDGVTEYWVTEYSAEERTANAVRPYMAKQAEMVY